MVESWGGNQSSLRTGWPKPVLTARTTSTNLATRTHDEPDEEGVEFIHEDDGSITARDKETGVASFGETKAEAVVMLAEALGLHDGDGEPVTDEDLEELGLDPETAGDEERPDFMQ